jgi:uncharacterized protein DUF6912
MRVYLPATFATVRAALEAGEFGPAPLTAFAVTPPLREWYAEADIEELEYAAMNAAGIASLRLLARHGDDAPRRVVVAADVADAAVRPAPDIDRAAVLVTAPVAVVDIASAHVDDPAAAEDIARAVAVIDAADAGDDDAQFVIDGVDEHELAWYAAQELPPLVAEDDR